MMMSHGDLKYEAETRRIKDRLSRVTKRSSIATGTRWSAIVSRYGIFDSVHWSVYSGQLSICSGETFFFRDAQKAALDCLGSKLRDQENK